MAKLVSKSDLSFKNGYIIDETGTVMNLSFRVWEQLIDLEMMVQRAGFAKVNGISDDDNEQVTMDDFVPVHRYKVTFGMVAKTPLLDKKMDEAMQLMEEIEDSQKAAQLTEAINEMPELLEFISSEYILVTSEGAPQRHDLAIIGNPLDLTRDTLGEIVKFLGNIECDEDEVTANDGESE